MIQKLSDLEGQEMTFLEQKLSEELILGSETLIEANAIQRYSAISKEVVEMVVKDRNIHYDILIKYKNEHIKSGICNCVTAKTQVLCPHIVTAIFYHRNKQGDTEKPKTEKKRRVNVVRLLSLIDKNEIEDLVGIQARRDRSFKLLMEARFFNRLSSSEQKAFFDSIYPIHVTNIQKVNASKLNLFLYAIDELQAHIKTCIHQENYTSAHRIISAAINKSYYIANKLERSNKKFDKTHQELIHLFHTNYERIEAPEFKTSVEDSLLELLGSNFVGATSSHDQSLWVLAYRKKTINKELSKIISNYKSFGRDKYASLINIFWIVLSPKAMWRARIEELDSQAIYDMVTFLKTTSEIKEKQKLLITILNEKDTNPYLTKMIITQLDPIIPNPDFSDKIVSLFMSEKESYYLKSLERLAPDWRIREREITERIRAKGDLLLELHLMIFNEDKMQTKKLLKDIYDWDILLGISSELYTLDSELLFNSYMDYLSYYLQNHFGLTAMHSVGQKLDEISILTSPSWTYTLRESLMRSFPNRHWD